MTALHYASNAGHLEVVNELLAASAEVNAVDEVSNLAAFSVLCEYYNTDGCLINGID